MIGIGEMLARLFGLGQSTVDLVREKEKRADEPVQLAETEKAKVDEKKSAIDEAIQPGADVSEIQKKTRYTGRD